MESHIGDVQLLCELHGLCQLCVAGCGLRHLRRKGLVALLHLQYLLLESGVFLAEALYFLQIMADYPFESSYLPLQFLDFTTPFFPLAFCGNLNLCFGSTCQLLPPKCCPHILRLLLMFCAWAEKKLPVSFLA